MANLKHQINQQNPTHLRTTVNKTLLFENTTGDFGNAMHNQLRLLITALF